MTKKDDVSIIIIGAGISGFTCATKLLEYGFNDIKILEAEDRIGGRIYTTDFAGGLIDLGAQWCHGIDGNIVHKLAGSDSFNETVMDFSKMSFLRSDGTKIDEKTCEKLMKLCDSVLEEIKAVKTGNVEEILTKKFFEALKSEEFKHIGSLLAQQMFDNYKKRESSYCGCENLSKIDIDGFNKFKDCEGPTWLNWKGKGYKSIFDFVLKNSNIAQEKLEEKILLQKQVTNIDWAKSSKSSVKCSDGTFFKADHVIVTVSLGVLKKNHEELFTPKIPLEKKQVLNEIPFGAVGKIFLQFDEKFWNDDWVGFSLLWNDEDLKELEGTENDWFSNIYCFYTVDFLPNVLLGRLAGDKIAQMEKLSDEEVVRSCELIFEKFLPNTKREKILNVKTSKWKSNKNFGGTYSYHIKNDDSIGILSQSLYDQDGKLKVLFAGEATHDHFFSTVHGAIESGYREAEKIAKLYEVKK